MPAEPSLSSAGIHEMVVLGDEFNAAIQDWNRARYNEGDLKLDKCVGVTSWQLALVIFIWKRAREVECPWTPVNTGESVQKTMDATPFDSKGGVLGDWGSL